MLNVFVDPVVETEHYRFTVDSGTGMWDCRQKASDNKLILAEIPFALDELLSALVVAIRVT